jgi:hypothetical protein
MTRSKMAPAWVWVLVGGVFAGCGGRLPSRGSGDDGSSDGASGDDGRGDGGSDDGQPCVPVDLATYDQSCQVDSDCVPIGTQEEDSCFCLEHGINAKELSRYKAALTSCGDGTCDCSPMGAARCVKGPLGGVCLYCPYQHPDDGTLVPPGCPGATLDAGACIDVNLSIYDRSCRVDSDCISVAAGTLCSYNACAFCGGSTINANAFAKYKAALATLPQGTGVCNCPSYADPHCAQGPSGGVCE